MLEEKVKFWGDCRK